MSDAGSEVAPRTLAALAVAAALTLGLLVVLKYDHSWGGPVLFAISDRHGLHVGDLPVLALWLAGLAGCAVWWRRG